MLVEAIKSTALISPLYLLGVTYYRFPCKITETINGYLVICYLFWYIPAE
jgi:hypothetical protein